jgi:hypothetical protein
MIDIFKWKLALHRRAIPKQTVTLFLSATTAAVIGITIITFYIYQENTKYHYYQYLKLIYRCKTCPPAKKAVIEDFNKGNYR